MDRRIQRASGRNKNKNTMNPTPTMTPFEQKLYKIILKLALKNLPSIRTSISVGNDNYPHKISIRTFPLIHTPSRMYGILYDFEARKFTKFIVRGYLYEQYHTRAVTLYEFDTPESFN